MAIRPYIFTTETRFLFWIAETRFILLSLTKIHTIWALRFFRPNKPWNCIVLKLVK